MTDLHHPELLRESPPVAFFTSPRQHPIDEELQDSAQGDHKELARRMWDIASESAGCLQNSLRITDDETRSRLTAENSHRTLRDVTRAALVACQVPHERSAGILELAELLTAATGTEFTSDLEFLAANRSQYLMDHIPQHQPHQTARLALQDAREITKLIHRTLQS